MKAKVKMLSLMFILRAQKLKGECSLLKFHYKVNDLRENLHLDVQNASRKPQVWRLVLVTWPLAVPPDGANKVM